MQRMQDQDLIPHLFRTEYSKIAAVLSRQFGLDHIEIAEDIASETFVAAMETWPYRGIPEQPTAWLYRVAKNKALNHLKQHQVFDKKITVQLKNEKQVGELEIDLSEQNIRDSQLQMLFAICHPAISAESQIALALRILCGFGVEEIADGFLTNKDTVNKRLFRAKEKLRSEKIELMMPPGAEIIKRLESIMKTIYLLFSEGYYSERAESVIRKELCLEAMRLNFLLLENPSTNLHLTNALMSLMCFQSSRLKARVGDNGEMILYQDQDASLWNWELIARGNYYLQKAAAWPLVSVYYLEASIAYWHTKQDDTSEKWENILHLYNHLLSLSYSPIAALNRTYALAKVRGNGFAIQEAEKLGIDQNHFYHLLLADLYSSHDKAKSKYHLQIAHSLCKTETERKLIEKKLKVV